MPSLPTTRHLSLFKDDSAIEKAYNSDAKTQYPQIVVTTTCAFCGTRNVIGQHTAIHSLAWMRKHWNELLPGMFECVGGYCSRQCEIKAAKAINNSVLTNP